MSSSEERYDLESIKQDVRLFFQDDDHWAYQYGTKATSCSTDSVFYKKQIQVIFEERYPHDMTGKAVNQLIDSGFFKDEHRDFGKNMHAIFVWQRRMRYVAIPIKEQTRIMERFFDDELNEGVGKYAEILVGHMFKSHQFKIVGRHTNTFGGKKWDESNKNLDFIIEKDGISYGVEVKNTFDYMPPDEFEEKVEMCRFLGLLPLFPLRCPSSQQFDTMKQIDGLALKFKTRIFPPGNRTLVADIWNHFRLPVHSWDEMLPTVQRVFQAYHRRNRST